MNWTSVLIAQNNLITTWWNIGKRPPLGKKVANDLNCSAQGAQSWIKRLSRRDTMLPFNQHNMTSSNRWLQQEIYQEALAHWPSSWQTTASVVRPTTVSIHLQPGLLTYSSLTKTCMRDFSEAELYIFSGAVFSFCLFFGDLSKLERRLGWTGNHRLSSMNLRLHKTLSIKVSWISLLSAECGLLINNKCCIKHFWLFQEARMSSKKIDLRWHERIKLGWFLFSRFGKLPLGN